MEIKLESMEILIRRMWALEISCQKGNRRDIASSIEEKTIGYNPDVVSQVGGDMGKLKLRKSLKDSRHHDKDGSGAK